MTTGDSTTTAPVTTTGDSTTTSVPATSAPTTTVLEPTDVEAYALWPDASGETRFDDPVEAARSFAVDVVGFTDPVLGELDEGDSRSGEVQVRPREDGPASIVLVRQLADADGADSWWVIGVSNEDIVLEDPQPQGAIDHPLLISGQARAFEGTVQVSVFADGSTTPIGEGFVTGSGGPDLGPFEGEIDIATPGGGWGTILLYTTSAEDGSVWGATAVRVGFIGGD